MVAPYKPIEAWKGQTPDQALVYRIQLNADENDFDIRPLKCKRFPIDKGNTLGALLKTVGTVPLGEVKLNKPFKSKMSFNADTLTYLIFVWKNKKLQFSNQVPPISTGDAYPSELFGDATKVNASGNPAGSGEDDCKIAYLVFDGATAAARFPTELAAGFSFNLHVDMVTKGEDAQGKSIPEYMPLTIDPDIRHPGGSGP